MLQFLKAVSSHVRLYQMAAGAQKQTCMSTPLYVDLVETTVVVGLMVDAVF